MTAKKYIVSLAPEERLVLEQLTKTGKAPAYKMNHARILLKADTNQDGGGWTDAAISQALDISVATIERVRQRFVETNLDMALARQVQQRKPRRFDGEQEAHLIALTCSEPPEGHGRWSLRLLADQLVELGYVENVSHETVGKRLKKRAQALVTRMLGDSTEGERRICLLHGECVECVYPSQRSSDSSSLL